MCDLSLSLSVDINQAINQYISISVSVSVAVSISVSVSISISIFISISLSLYLSSSPSLQLSSSPFPSPFPSNARPGRYLVVNLSGQTYDTVELQGPVMDIVMSGCVPPIDVLSRQCYTVVDIITIITITNYYYCY